MTEGRPGLNPPEVETVLGPLASAVMRVLWSGGDTTLRSLISQVSREGRTPAYTTITTILARLRARGLVERARRGREAVYRAAISEPDLIEASSSRAVDELIARYGDSAMRHFAERLADSDPELRSRLISLAGSRLRWKSEKER
jgi:predicted transcriptional regulator